jgi:hypothetical protein
LIAKHRNSAISKMEICCWKPQISEKTGSRLPAIIWTATAASIMPAGTILWEQSRERQGTE